jgi:mannose-6-phosphate isomerase-like protein (cupin superfamily)
MTGIGNESPLLLRQKECKERLLANISDQDVQEWLSEENLRTKSKRSFAGFEITANVDGSPDTQREISLVRLLNAQVYPQHVHRYSDTLFIAVQGQAILLSGSTRTVMVAGDRLAIPKGMPHGFELVDGEPMEFLSIQQPPIRDHITGEEDLTFSEEELSLTSMI